MDLAAPHHDPTLDDEPFDEATELLEKAFAVVRMMPARSQDKIARIMLAATENDEEPYVLTPEEEEAVAEGRAAAARGEFATDEEMEALWAKFEG